MFKGFDTIKAQLTELAPAINAFKSEAVQLRILELIFAGRYDRDDEPVDKHSDQSRLGRYAIDRKSNSAGKLGARLPRQVRRRAGRLALS